MIQVRHRYNKELIKVVVKQKQNRGKIKCSIEIFEIPIPIPMYNEMYTKQHNILFNQKTIISEFEENTKQT